MSSFLIFKDETNENIKEIINKTIEKLGKDQLGDYKENYSNSISIKTISPSLIINIKEKEPIQLLPKFLINKEETLNSIDVEKIKKKEDLIPLKEIPESTLSKLNKEEEEEKGKKYEILEPDNIEEEPRLEMDKENLLKAFKFGMDPFDTCIIPNKDNDEEEEEEEEEDKKYELKYKSLEDRLNEMFNIKLE
jgi:hypothetical protein